MTVRSDRRQMVEADPGGWFRGRPPSGTRLERASPSVMTVHPYCHRFAITHQVSEPPTRLFPLVREVGDGGLEPPASAV